MKLNNLIKFLPLVLTLIFTIFIYINNKNENTKLRILFWATPSFSLGTYLSIATVSGFMLSYILTTDIANSTKSKSTNSINSNPNKNNEENYEYPYSNFNHPSEKTLIERNINDPSPTVNAQFRVIGDKERYNKNNINNNLKYDNINNFEDQYLDENENNETNIQENEVVSDWSDNSFTNW